MGGAVIPEDSFVLVPLFSISLHPMAGSGLLFFFFPLSFFPFWFGVIGAGSLMTGVITF